jgi:hypothetical protein
MNTPLRVLLLLLIGSGLAAAQQPDCSTVEILASRPLNTVTTPTWRIYVRNNSPKTIVVRFSPLDFHWKIEGASKQGWQESLAGGIGPGKPSIGASLGRGTDTRTIKKHHASLVTDFDVRRDVPIDGALKPGRRYRIMFAQDVALLGDNETVCKLVAKPQLFTARRSVNGR